MSKWSWHELSAQAKVQTKTIWMIFLIFSLCDVVRISMCNLPMGWLECILCRRHRIFLYCLALHPHTSCWDGNMHCRCLHSIFFLFPWRSCDGSLPPGLADDMLAMPHCWVMWSDRWYRTTEESQACWARRWCLQEAKSCCRNDIANWHLSLSFC